MTELTSNTATPAAFLPVVAAVAVEAGYPPMALAAPVAMALQWASPEKQKETKAKVFEALGPSLKEGRLELTWAALVATGTK